jgi:hypothetical protein
MGSVWRKKVRERHEQRDEIISKTNMALDAVLSATSTILSIQKLFVITDSFFLSQTLSPPSPHLDSSSGR